MQAQGIRITKSGVYLPPTRQDNAEVIERLGLAITPAEMERTGGVRVRRVLSEAKLARLSTACARPCLDPHRPPDLLVHTSTTPDSPSPAAAHRLHRRLGLPPHTQALDVTSSCTSFLSALGLVAPWVDSRGASALIVSAEAKSRHLRRGEGRLASLFGDGAAAMSLESPSPSAQESLLWTEPFVDSALGENIRVEEDPDGCFLVMDEARLMYRRTVQAFTEQVGRGLELASKQGFPVRSVYLHQANRHILEEIRSHFPEPHIPALMSDIGNLVSASLPAHRVRCLVLEAALSAYRLEAGESVPRLGELIAWLDERGHFKRDGGACTLSAQRGHESLFVSDGSGEPSWLGDMDPEEWQVFAQEIATREQEDGFRGLQKGRVCDLLVGAGGGFQALGVLHIRQPSREGVPGVVLLSDERES